MTSRGNPFWDPLHFEQSPKVDKAKFQEKEELSGRWIVSCAALLIALIVACVRDQVACGALVLVVGIGSGCIGFMRYRRTCDAPAAKLKRCNSLSLGYGKSADRHLVLNFDVNKTILMSDAIQNKSVNDIVNEVLADAAWGSIQNGEWKLGVTEPSTCRPTIDGKEILSYSESLGKSYPGSKNKKVRNEILKKFTSEGEPGEDLAGHAKKLAAGLRLPDGSAVQIIPSFFELLCTLKRKNRSFTLCFRTFGEDLEAITKELNVFCEGRHPLSQDGLVFDGSDGDVDYRVTPGDPEKCGTFYRDSSTSASIIWGTWWQPEKEPVPGMACYDSMQGIEIVSGSLFDMGKHLRQKWRKPGSVALRDYFLYWKEQEMTALGGKPLFYKFSEYSVTHEVFFDDNIQFSDAHIVHPVDMSDPERVSWASALLRTHLCRAEPLHSITDNQYFVSEVARLELAYSKKLLAAKRLRHHLWQVVFLVRIGAFKKSVQAKETKQEVEDESYDPWSKIRRNDSEFSRRSQEDDVELEGREL